MRKKFVILFVIFLLAAHVAFAQEDFSVMSKKSYTLCPCSNQGYPLLISNTGSTQSTYSLYANEEVAEWITISPPKFTLDSGQTTQIVVYVNAPCEVTTSLPVNLFITTSTGLTKGLNQIVQFTSCYDHALYSGEPVILGEEQKTVAFTNYEGDYSLCAEDITTIPLLIQNKDDAFDNQYTLAVQGAAWATIEPSTFDLGKQKSGVVFLTATPGISNTGEHQLAILSTSKKGEVAREKALNIDIQQCHDASLQFLEGKTDLCSGIPHTFAAEITNQGKFEETFSLKLEGEPWASLDKQEFTLQPNTKGTVFLTIEPENSAAGNYDLTLSAHYKGTEATGTLSVDLTPLNTCHNVAVDTLSEIKNDYNEQYVPVRVMNNGGHKATYSFTFNGPSWVNFDGTSVTLNPGQVYNFNLHLNPSENIQKGTYPSTLRITSDHVDYSQDITIQLEAKSNFEQWAVSTSYHGRYYFFVLAILIFLVILFRKPLLNSWTKMRKRQRQQKARLEALKKAREQRAQKNSKVVAKIKPKKEKRKRKKKYSLHEKLGFFLVFLALLFGFSLILYPTKMKSIIEPYLASVVAGLVGVLALLVIFSLLHKGFKTVLHHFEK